MTDCTMQIGVGGGGKGGGAEGFIGRDNISPEISPHHTLKTS